MPVIQNPVWRILSYEANCFLGAASSQPGGGRSARVPQGSPVRLSPLSSKILFDPGKITPSTWLSSILG